MQVPFALHTLLRYTHCTAFSREFCTKCVRISHKAPEIRISTRITCTTNFAVISQEFRTNFTWIHMTVAQLSQEKYNSWSPHPSSFHAERRFKPHTQQHPDKGPAQQADSSNRSHPGSQSGPEPRPQYIRNCIEKKRTLCALDVLVGGRLCTWV